jgi:hypothetical protein
LEIILAHSKSKSIFGDTRICDKDIDRTQSTFNLCEGLIHARLISNIHQNTFEARWRLARAVRYYDAIACSLKGSSNCKPNSAISTSY